MRIAAALLLAGLVAACGSPSRTPEPEPPPPPATGPVGLYVDEDCYVQADSVLVILPAVLRPELRVDSIVGRWEGSVYRGHGRVDVRLRKLRIVADAVEIHVGEGPVENLRIQAEGTARISSGTVERVDPPADAILVRPDRVLLQ